MLTALVMQQVRLSVRLCVCPAPMLCYNDRTDFHAVNFIQYNTERIYNALISPSKKTQSEAREPEFSYGSAV